MTLWANQVTTCYVSTNHKASSKYQFESPPKKSLLVVFAKNLSNLSKRTVGDLPMIRKWRLPVRACKFSQTNYFEKKSPRNCSFDFELPESLVMFMQLSGKVRKKSDARIDYRANWNMNFKSATQRKTIKILSNTTFTNPKSPFLILILSISSCQS